MKTLAFTPAAATALALICAAAPVVEPSPTHADESALVLVAAVKDIAPHKHSEINPPGSNVGVLPAAFTPVVPTPTLLDVLGLPIQVPLAIVAGINPPPNTNPQSYTSVYTVINNAISVARVPLALLLTGQFSGIPAQTVAAWNTFFTSLTLGLPQSVAATLQHAADVVLTYVGAPAPVTTVTEAGAAVAADTRYTVLDVLGLPIQTAFAIIAGGTAGVTLPTSPLIPSPYTSVYTVVNNAISVVRVPLSLAFTGQFDEIGSQTAAAFNTFVTSLTQGLPASIRGTLEYDVSVINGFLRGVGAPNTLSANASATADALKADSAGTPAAIEAPEPADDAQAEPETDGGRGFLDRVQTAVDRELGAVPPVADDPSADPPEEEAEPETGDRADAADESEDAADEPENKPEDEPDDSAGDKRGGESDTEPRDDARDKSDDKKSGTVNAE